MPGGIRQLARRLVSPSARRAARDRLENLRDWVDVFAFRLRLAATRTPLPRLVICFGFSPGDDLLCTAVLRELRNRGRDGMLMVSDHRDLFAGNPDPAWVRPLWPRYYRYGSTVAICRRFVSLWGGEFSQPGYAPLLDADRSRPPPRHIIAQMCAEAGVTGAVAIRPYLELTGDEAAAGSWARGRIAIQSSGMAARLPMRNKQWPTERIQAVVDALRDEIEFIQIGSAADPPLQNVTDLRGAAGIRQTAAILHHARLFVGTVGFPMHLARAAECPSVIVFGGREAPWQSGYICNSNLYSAVPCAPCWRWNNCEFDRQCMSGIAAADVVAAIRQMLARPRGPLAVETVEIAPAAGH